LYRLVFIILLVAYSNTTWMACLKIFLLVYSSPPYVIYSAKQHYLEYWHEMLNCFVTSVLNHAKHWINSFPFKNKFLSQKFG